MWMRYGLGKDGDEGPGVVLVDYVIAYLVTWWAFDLSETYASLLSHLRRILSNMTPKACVFRPSSIRD